MSINFLKSKLTDTDADAGIRQEKPKGSAHGLAERQETAAQGSAHPCLSEVSSSFKWSIVREFD